MNHNIFNYATSELSQDAFICWLVSWVNGTNRELKALALDFIKTLLEMHAIEFPNVENLEKVEIQKQYLNIDVLLRLYFRNDRIVQIIIEDKTNTSFHDNQLRVYMDRIENKKIENIQTIGIYYKTGFVFDDEKSDVEKNGYTVFTKDRMYQVIKRHMSHIQSEILYNYFEYLESLIMEERKIEVKMEEIIQNDRMHDADEILKSQIGQWIFMKKIFQHDIKGWQYNGSSMGRPWTQYCILEQIIFKQLPDAIFYRMDSRNEGYYLSVRQYLNFVSRATKQFLETEDEAELIQDKMKRLDRLKKCYRSSLDCEVLNHCEFRLVEGTISNRGRKESEIGVFFINKDNSFRKIISFTNAFNNVFKSYINKEFGVSIE